MVFIINSNDPEREFKEDEIKRHFPPGVIFKTRDSSTELLQNQNYYYDEAALPHEVLRNWKNIFVIKFSGKSWEVKSNE